MPGFNPRPTITLPFQADKRLNKKYSLVQTESRLHKLFITIF